MRHSLYAYSPRPFPILHQQPPLWVYSMEISETREMPGLWPYAGCSKADTCPNTDGSPGYVSRRPSCGRGPGRAAHPEEQTKHANNDSARRAEAPAEKAWRILHEGLPAGELRPTGKAVRALGLLAGSAEAEKAAVQGLRDEKPSVRSAAATALGSMHAEHGGISKRRWGQRTERCAGRDEFAAAASRRCWATTRTTKCSPERNARTRG